MHENRDIKCQHCHLKSSIKNVLKAHIESVHNKQEYKCEHCDCKASAKNLLETHVNSVHTKQKLSLDIRDFLKKMREEQNT